MTRAAAWAARAAAPAVVLVLASATLSGCGASPAKVGPTGIDELTIPTPSPDPEDFGGGATNQWFPLAPGTRWTYRQESTTSNRRVVAEVMPHTRTIAGIATTAVRWRGSVDGTVRTLMVRWYAVDRLGNVWWFGQRVTRQPPLDSLARRSFLAGRHGAEAGLILSATPRDGDGYFNAQQPRVVQRRSTVLSLRSTVATSTRTYHGVVVTRDLSSLAPVHVVQSYFARGIGMIAQVDTRSASTSLTLVRVRRP
jgi:hypothetical protein